MAADALANESKFAPTPWWLLEPIQNRAFAEAHILPKLRPHQKLMVVPGFCALPCLPGSLPRLTGVLIKLAVRRRE